MTVKNVSPSGGAEPMDKISGEAAKAPPGKMRPSSQGAAPNPPRQPFGRRRAEGIDARPTDPNTNRYPIADYRGIPRSHWPFERHFGRFPKLSDEERRQMQDKVLSKLKARGVSKKAAAKIVTESVGSFRRSSIQFVRGEYSPLLGGRY